MKVAFLTPSLSRTAGGIFEIERRLAQSLADLPGTSLQVFGAQDEHTLADLPLWQPLKPQAFPYWGPGNLRYSPRLRSAFLKCDADVAHLHAIWMHTSLILSAWSKRRKRPYVTTANGMLDSWALNNSRGKKRVVAALYERRCLEQAACIQANSEAELCSIRSFGLSNPVCIIPNGVDLNNRSPDLVPPWHVEIPPRENVLLYLGRLHPKKNLTALLRAWQSVSGAPHAKAWHLVIAGWDQLGHGAELRELAAKQCLPRVLFIGPQYGDAKASAFNHASAVVLPSLSEGLPMVVLEAWAAAKPVLMTEECNLAEGFASNAAIRIGSDAEGIASGMKQLFTTPAVERYVMGEHGLALVKRRFAWPVVARQLREVYAWVASGGSAPECVKCG